MKPIEMEIWRITPEVAEALLTKNYKNNRSLKRVEISKIANDMQMGKWALTHQGIALDPDGYLFDGQNRLNAVVKSGCTVKMCVFKYNDWGITKAAFEALDIGVKRSTRDAVILAGGYGDYAKNNQMIATVKRLIWFKKNIPYSQFTEISNEEVMDYMKRHESMLSDIYGITRGRSKYLNASCITAIALAYINGESYEDLYNFVDTFSNNNISFSGKQYNCKSALTAKDFILKMSDSSAKRKENIIVFQNYIYAYIHGLMKVREYKERYPYNKEEN